MGSRRHRRAFWMMSFAFLAVMAFSPVPSPRYGLYRERDHFSLLMVTVIYAVNAVGVIGSLLLAGHLSDWYGRRRLLLGALGLAIVKLVGRTTTRAAGGPTAVGRGADSPDVEPGYQPIDKPRERRAA